MIKLSSLKANFLNDDNTINQKKVLEFFNEKNNLLSKKKITEFLKDLNEDNGELFIDLGYKILNYALDNIYFRKNEFK